MKVTKKQLRRIIREAITASHQFASSGFISLENDPSERVEVSSDGNRISIEMNDFMAFLRKAGLTEGVMQESPVRIGASTQERITQARQALGDDEFIMALASRIKPVELDNTLTRMFRELGLKIGGVQYF